MIGSVSINGLEPNADGLYLLNDVNTRFAEAMTAYNNIVDVPTAIQAPLQEKTQKHAAAIYSLEGQRLDAPQRGINIISGNKKVFLRK